MNHYKHKAQNGIFVYTEASSAYSSLDVLRRTQYRTPVGPLENAVLCCALFTKPYHSNGGAVLLRVWVAMGILLHSNVQLQTSIVADRLSMFATCGRVPWKAPTKLTLNIKDKSHKITAVNTCHTSIKNIPDSYNKQIQYKQIQ
jgi:hypothetical protein